MSKHTRPRKYTRVLCQEICNRIAQGESLRRIAEDAAMPELGTLIAWLDRYATFRAAYDRAREIEADILADEVVDIADSEADDTATAAKLRVDARKWLAAKLKPATYGEAKAPPRRAAPRPVVYRVTTGIPKAPDEPAAEEGEESKGTRDGEGE